MKSLPEPGTDSFKQLIDWELEKCMGGVTVNGVLIPGWLYFHLNHWLIRLDVIDNYGNIVKTPGLPDLRDNEWIRGEALEECRKQRLGYMEIGLRQGGKDLLNSSLLYQNGKEITIADCQVGDQIYDDQGKLTTIQGKFPQGIKPVYKVELLDGRKIYCGLEHNWYVYDRITKKHHKKTTQELIQNYKKYPFNIRYAIDTTKPVEYSYKTLDVDPYKYGRLDLEFIPPSYKYSSIEQRRELLRGIIDEWGINSSTGDIEFSTHKKLFSEDFEFLCRGLGINISRKTKEGLEIFTLFISKDTLKNKYEDRVGICDISYVYDEETTCIQVDNESHLFLTDGFTITHNSEFEASITGYNALMFKDTQNVIVGGNDADLTLLKDKVDFGLKSMWEGIAIPRIDKDWKKPMVKLGYKSRGGDDDIWSYLIIRNAADGKNTEAAAGTTAKSFVMDEVGKYFFGQVFESAKPAFLSEWGWRTIPILVGTGGSFDNGADAERFFYNPEANKFLEFIDEVTGMKTCLFMPGTFRQDCKYDTNLADYLQRTRGREITSTEELEKIDIKVSDKEKAKEVILRDREQKAKDPDKTEYLKQIMFYPLTPEECFLSEVKNIYNTEAAKNRQRKLYDENIKGFPIEIYHNGTTLTHRPSSKLPISSFPVKPNESKDAPVVMWEPPIPNPPFGLYVAGVDTYRFNDTKYSDSLGAVYIFKRIHSIAGDKYQDMFVASYVARPKLEEEWNETALNLIKYYNATAMVENDEPGFIKWVINKGDERYLADSVDWLKAVDVGTTTTRSKGIHRSHEKVRNLLRSSFKEYLNEVIQKVLDENGNEVGQVLGVERVLDPMLLEEIIKFNPDINVDREVAASIAVAYANHLNPIVHVNSTSKDPRYEAIFSKEKRATNNLFKPVKSTFGPKRKRKLF